MEPLGSRVGTVGTDRRSAQKQLGVEKIQMGPSHFPFGQTSNKSGRRGGMEKGEKTGTRHFTSFLLPAKKIVSEHGLFSCVVADRGNVIVFLSPRSFPISAECARVVRNPT